MTVLRREEALSWNASPETEISCRKALSRISPFVPGLVRHLSLSNFLRDYAVFTDIG